MSYDLSAKIKTIVNISKIFLCKNTKKNKKTYNFATVFLPEFNALRLLFKKSSEKTIRSALIYLKT
jgi:hypothetical protein